MATTAERLRQAMYLTGIKQAELSKRTGINRGTLSAYMSGKYVPKQTRIYQISRALGVNEPWLMGLDVPMRREGQPAIKIPILGRVAAGIPIEAIEDIIGEEEIPETMAMGGEYFGILIKGDSMEPRILDGDVVIVRKQSDADSGDLVIALINGEDGVCKRLMKYPESIALVSNNPKYAPLVFTLKEVEEKPVQIIGKVVELRGKY